MYGETLKISLEEISAELRGSLDTNDISSVEWMKHLVGKAERTLFALCPATETKVKAGDTKTAATAKDLVIEAVARVARVDPDSVGYRSESEDGYSYSIDPLTRAGNIWFPDSDLERLACGPRARNFLPRSARLARGTAWYGGA